MLNDGVEFGNERGAERVEASGDGEVEGKVLRVKEGTLKRKRESDPESELPKLKPEPGPPISNSFRNFFECKTIK